MRIEHVALWCKDLEGMRTFYSEVFCAVPNTLYRNPATGFRSYFLTFPGGGARLELMDMPGLEERGLQSGLQRYGQAHFSIQTGAKERVRQLGARLAASGGVVIRGPRTTGDGYYELEALDPEGNRLEIME